MRDPEGFAQAMRSIRRSLDETLSDLTRRIDQLERNKPSSPRLPELWATLHELEAHPEKYE